MDRTAMVVMLLVLSASAAAVASVHRLQKQERRNLHAGVVRDEALLSLKRAQLHEQQQLHYNPQDQKQKSPDPQIS
ncbi:hypothetical protein O6H91_06G139200 [Diphasiastrum complanatum]|uniref:Uncharacterized protein n=1 Tax=Diphasiastrum complanatum TaxID=34168 RepID=A0ACC2DJE3_DIPCM|nr:hypothetical protein O6H91_06G139200 [Diphasiastrum complanatum]